MSPIRVQNVSQDLLLGGNSQDMYDDHYSDEKYDESFNAQATSPGKLAD